MKQLVAVLLFLPLLFTACNKETTTVKGNDEVKIGPPVDKVYMNVRMKEEIGLKDVAEGKSDVFVTQVDGAVIKGLDQETKNKLDFYAVPSGSWSLIFNPIPNKAPYTVTPKGKSEEFFNPYAIKEVRYAMHFLISRKYIVDEIMDGSGGPMTTMATPPQPGTYRYNLLASRMGITAEGDEEKALKDIAAAMEKASKLPALAGKLVKGDEFWMYNGKPVTVNFLIRVDDPQGRLKEGHYVADQIEKAGIKVERLLWDRSKCGKAVYGSDPAEYVWSLYTEGWGAGETRGYWDQIVSQMYGPWYGYMPGGADPNNWNYTNEELDEVSKKGYTGNFLDEEEYWKLVLRGTELGLQDAVRIYIAYQTQYYAANKERFKNRMVYGLGDGINRWSILTANTTDGILRATAYSAKGALFMHPWDPIGTDGYSDVFTSVISEPTCSMSYFTNPATGTQTPELTKATSVESKVARVGGKIVGEIAVDPKAVKYDSKTKTWVTAKEGTTAISKVTYEINYYNYHHGRPMSKADIMYREAFREEWVNKDSEDDLMYDSTIESSIRPVHDIKKGFVYNDDGTITSYFDYNFPASKSKVAAFGAPDINIKDGRLANVCWEIVEACAKIVVEGSASGAAYSFTYGEATSFDMINPACVADIKAKLIEMKEAKYVPVPLKDVVTADEAVDFYGKAISWIEEHGHAHIANGGFYIEKYDPTSNYIELTAFRDPTYPFKSNYWTSLFTYESLRIDSVEAAPMVSKKEAKSLPVTLYVSKVSYPSGKASMATEGKVKVILITQTEEMEFPAIKKEDGVFTAEIPADVLGTLEPGSYTILAMAEIEGGAIPASQTVSTTVY